MGRKHILRVLPPLQQASPGFTGFPEGYSKQRGLIDKLRGMANRLKKTKPQPFYSMREIAGYFGVPLRTCAIAYETLEHEGILNRIRGSQTLLAGRNTAPRKAVRAVVGIPVWLHSIVISPYTRAFYMKLEDELRNNGFVVDFIFFHGNEVEHPDFAERLVRHNLDILFWHTPHPLATQVLFFLRDHGTQLVFIQNAGSTTSMHCSIYLQDWQRAYHDMAQALAAKGIQRVVVPEPDYMPSKRALKGFSATMEMSGIEVEIIQGEPDVLLHKAKQLSKGNRGMIAFMDQQVADMLCSQEPVVIEKVLQLVPVAFCRGPIRIPYFERREGKVDIIGFSPSQMATKIVHDFCRSPVLPGGVIHTFHATYQPSISLNSIHEPL